MHKLLDPRCLWGVAVVPLLGLWCLGYYQYTLIESLLQAHQQGYWHQQGGALFALIFVAFGGSVALDAAGKRIGILHLAVLFTSVVSYGSWTVAALDDLFPVDVPNWLLDDRATLYVPTFLMPALVYTLFAAIHLSTRADRSYSAWPNFIAALFMPLMLYVFATVVVPAVHPLHDVLPEQVATIIAVVFSTVFVFFVLRAVYLLGRNREWWSVRGHLAFRFLLTVCCPLIGLVLNNSSLFNMDVTSPEGVFGNFGHPLFYSLAALNGIYCCLPRRDMLGYRAVLFAAGCSGLPFLLYFVLVFLPFVPLAVLATVYYGAGLLMLVPLMMLPVQLRFLKGDYAYLVRHINPRYLLAAGLVLCCLLPGGITVAYRADRYILQEALDYVYSPVNQEVEIDPRAVERVIHNISLHRKSEGAFMGNEKMPYLSQYYAWLVLDNLTLSNDKLDRLSRVYLGTGYDVSSRTPDRNSSQNTELIDLSSESSWDAGTETWTSWVHLEVAADTLHGNLGEYAVRFDLPPGCFIDDYYLYVGERKKHGLLSERGVATWVYNQVVGTQRDPGLLRYEGADRIRLSVYPFRRGDVRRTGFRVRHRDPVNLQIDGKTTMLGIETARARADPVTFAGGCYLPASFKASLPAVRLLPQIHFVLDASHRSPEAEAELIERIHQFTGDLPSDFPEPIVNVCGTYVRQMSYRHEWEQQLHGTPAGGFFAQRAVDRIFGNVTGSSRTYPVVIIVGEDPVLDDDLSIYAAGVPFDPKVYDLGSEGRLTVSYEDGVADRDPSNYVPLPKPITAYAFPTATAPMAWLRMDNKPEIVLTTDPEPAAPNPNGVWTGAMEQYADYLRNRRSGRTGRPEWLKEVRGSFRSGVLMPTTAFLVLENAAQEEALRRKQVQILSADPRLDLEEVTAMSEPGWWLLPLCLPLLWYFSPALRRKTS
ncbi:putative secreted protein with MSEP-CTERM motif [Neolewinella xylanilytica]|uniref:Putative secreted protein with MSEP-CTERM motif n=1 Tax=Neolewinella xylanilytica TaxID=1514080 RepID=A0A2S6I4K3_9BACT|nr:MSEP-CTERM sorting domain-containing protein [Neolewinella xylanilytica]PPK86084.1 putative secreted protein with MSEP-CTERM motif [Neolewinella xylanilytica]